MLTRALGEQQALVFYLTAVLLLLWSYLQAWQVVGTWRSAADSRRSHGRAVRAFVVQGLLVLAVINSSCIIVASIIPPLLAVLRNTPVPIAGATVRNHGRRIDFDGPVGASSVSLFSEALEAAPTVTLVRLESGGGSVVQARAIANMISAAGLDTEVTQDCVSACTIIFSAGRHRWLREGVRLGFHSYRSDAMTPEAIVRDEGHERRAYASSGISPAFIERIFSVPPAQIWYPTRDEVEAAGFAMGSFATSGGPAPTSRPPTERIRALREHALLRLAWPREPTRASRLRNLT